jgi:adhesin transport system membrane fusion protein
MRQSDFAFVNDIRAASELATPVTSRILLAAIIALVITGVVWAHFAVLDEVKRGNGRVVSSRQIQIVQSLEGGIVLEILIQEGRPDDLLVEFFGA